MVLLSNPAGGVDRIVQWQHGHTRSQDNVLGHGQCLGHEQFGHLHVLPSLGDVLANPCLTVPKLVRLYDYLDVTVVRVCVRPPWGCKGIINSPTFIPVLQFQSGYAASPWGQCLILKGVIRLWQIIADNPTLNILA